MVRLNENLVELRKLVSQTEAVCRTLERLIPKDEDWLRWRHTRMKRSLAETRRRLHRLSEALQIMVIEKVVEKKLKGK